MLTTVFLLFLVGFFLLAGVSVADLLPKRKQTMKQQVERANRPNTGDPVSLFWHSARQTLLMQGVSDPELAAFAAGCVAISAAMLVGEFSHNLFLVPVLIVLLSLIPVAIITVKQQAAQRETDVSLESALSAVTTTYLRGDLSIVQAVEESRSQMSGPARQMLELFLVQATMVDASITDALENMKLTMHNSIAVEWVNAVIRCQIDRGLKSTLPRILDKFSDRRTVLGEVDVLLVEPRRTFFIMLGAAALTPLLLRFLNWDWWTVLVTTVGGKVLLALHLLGMATAAGIAIWAFGSARKVGDIT